MAREGVKRIYNVCVTIEERIQRIEHNLDLLAAAQERLSAADERLTNRLAAAEERVTNRLAAVEERLAASDEQLAVRIAAADARAAAAHERIANADARVAAVHERLANNDVLIMNSLETRAEWEAKMAARVEQAEKDDARHQQNMTRIEATIAEISQKLSEVGDKLNGLIGYVDGFKRDDRPPR
jgi:chromosome segregation ATPase